MGVVTTARSLVATVLNPSSSPPSFPSCNIYQSMDGRVASIHSYVVVHNVL